MNLSAIGSSSSHELPAPSEHSGGTVVDVLENVVLLVVVYDVLDVVEMVVVDGVGRVPVLVIDGAGMVVVVCEVGDVGSNAVVDAVGEMTGVVTAVVCVVGDVR